MITTTMEVRHAAQLWDAEYSHEIKDRCTVIVVTAPPGYVWRHHGRPHLGSKVPANADLMQYDKAWTSLVQRMSRGTRPVSKLRRILSCLFGAASFDLRDVQFEANVFGADYHYREESVYVIIDVVAPLDYVWRHNGRHTLTAVARRDDTPEARGQVCMRLIRHMRENIRYVEGRD